jgi:hypothetical protein
VPIVTTGDPAVGFDPTHANTVNTAGALGQPGTRVLLGGSGINFPAFSGARLTLGCWTGDDQRLGFEAVGFLLGRQTERFTAGSDATGSPPLYFPIFSGIAGAERAIPIADPLRGFSGTVSVDSSLQLGGLEGNVACTLYRFANWEVAVLAGYRYAELKESLHIQNTTRDLVFDNTMILNDSFHTDNRFYGGQIGGRMTLQEGWFSLDVVGKLALGTARQVVTIRGDITQTGPNPLVPPGLGTVPGGLYAQPTNIGEFNGNPVSVPFVIMPSLEVKLGYQVTEYFRLFAGYDYLYWSRVFRPGNLIDHAVNLSQNAVLDPSGVGTLVGPAVPAPQFNRSAFWAQGLSLGLDFRF